MKLPETWAPWPHGGPLPLGPERESKHKTWTPRSPSFKSKENRVQLVEHIVIAYVIIWCVYIYIDLYIFMYIYIKICIHNIIYVYNYIYTYMYIHIYIYIYILYIHEYVNRCILHDMFTCCTQPTCCLSQFSGTCLDAPSSQRCRRDP